MFRAPVVKRLEGEIKYLGGSVLRCWIMPAAITPDAVIPSTSNTKWDQEISKEPGWGGGNVGDLNRGPSNHLSPAGISSRGH